jgi:hypothetical protein
MDDMTGRRHAVCELATQLYYEATKASGSTGQKENLQISPSWNG